MKLLYILLGLCIVNAGYSETATKSTPDTTPSQPAAETVPEIKPITDSEVIVLLKDGKRIDAIKAVRETRKISLKEAVQAVKEIEESLKQK